MRNIPIYIMLVLFLFCAIAGSVPLLAAGAAEGLVGHWSFDDGTGKDLSGNGNDAVLGGGRIYSLGKGRGCIRLLEDAEPMRIPVSEDSPLAISRGTICFWLNAGWGRTRILGYDNSAVQLNQYRGDFQVRFQGEDDFVYGAGILDYDWPKYDMREWAFYGHPRAAIGDSQWHLFAVAYDDKDKKIIGWRDGELISVVDLSTVGMEPLRRDGLGKITTGEGFRGFVDDLRIYNRVLSDADIREIYDSTKSVYAGRRDTIRHDKKVETYKYRQEDRTLYRAWLQYNPVEVQGQNLLKCIVAEGKNSTVRTAASELRKAARSMFDFEPSVERKYASGAKVILGTAETSSWIRRHADELGLGRIKEDGFIIKAVKDGDETILVIAGDVPAGVIFGAFDLVRRIQLGQDMRRLDVLENPQIPIRMVDHWSYFRGFLHDAWRGGGRDDSIYSWEELRTGDTKLIRDWVRMMASAGWNAICPSEVNWDYRDNFLDHLDEVEILAGILRDYGMKLYWSPSYLLALDQKTAEKLYARVPDFGGYMMKLGSEKQNGDPRPPMANRIADTVLPYGGHVLIRGFVYGNLRYTPEPYRDLIPHDIFAPEDGKFRENVVLVPKGSAGDWDFSAPIPAIDGAMRKTLSGSELVIDKGFPCSWVEKWKWWLEQDTYRSGPGSFNKSIAHCIMGVAMISPGPAWTSSPLNMVNYYGLGRLAWNPDRCLDEIYHEWIVQTFGNDAVVIDTVRRILLMSDDVARKLYMYRGYRGIWIDRGDENMVENKTPYAINREQIGPASPKLQKRILAQYAPGLREVYGDPLRGEEFLCSFHIRGLDFRLSIGRTLIEDVYGGMEEAVQIAGQMAELWRGLDGRIDGRRFEYTLGNLVDFVEDAKRNRDEMARAFEEHTGRKRGDVLSRLTASGLAAVGTYNVRHFGAVGDGTANDAPAINKAIDACSKAGGGTVFVPSGFYTTGSIQLKSNVTLALDKGAVLKAMSGVMDPREGSLIWGTNLENVKIYGPGALDGTGDKGIALKLCKNVEIRNLNIAKGGRYAILAADCEDVLIDNVTIKTDRDGVNLSGCKNVLLAYCHIDAVRHDSDRPAIVVDDGTDVTVESCYLREGANAENRPLEKSSEITFQEQPGKVLINVGEETIGTYVYEDTRILRPYFTGLKAPSGVQVTRRHPPRKGVDSDDHATMHPGLWLAFGDISGSDFWRNKGRVRHGGFVNKPYSGKRGAGFAVRNLYEANGKIICEEICRIRILNRSAGYLILWESEFRSDREAFYFGDQEEMGLGVRLATPIVVKNKKGGRILDDKGNINEKQIWGKPSLWCDYAGPIDGVFAGVMIMPDPDNFGPCRWHVRDYGFMTANPFGKKAFNLGDPGKVIVEKGKSLRLGFGILVHSSNDEKAIDLNAAYKDYLKVRR